VAPTALGVSIHRWSVAKKSTIGSIVNLQLYFEDLNDVFKSKFSRSLKWQLTKQLPCSLHTLFKCVSLLHDPTTLVSNIHTYKKSV
jgi:hypothetical protein